MPYPNPSFVEHLENVPWSSMTTAQIDVGQNWCCSKHMVFQLFWAYSSLLV